MKEKKNNLLTMRMDDELKERIEKQAEEEHRTSSDFVRHCVLNYLEKVEEVKRMTGKQ